MSEDEIISHGGVRRRILIASCAAACVGWITIFIQPVLLTEMMARFRLGEAAAGMALTVEMIAVAASSLLCARICRGRSFLAIAVSGAIIAAAGSWASLIVSDYSTLLMARIITGIGEGVALMVAGAAPARFEDPDRAYATINVATLIAGTIVVYLAPFAPVGGQGAMMFGAALIAFLIAIPVMLFMPAALKYQPVTHYAHVPVSRSMGALWTSFALLTTASAAVVSLCGVFGQRAGVSADGVNAAIALSILFALVGSFLSSVLGARMGRLRPMLAGLGVITAMLTAMSQIRDPNIFQWSVCLQMLGVYFVLPYFFGAAAEADPSGRGVAGLNAAIPLSYALGPVLGGYVLQHTGVVAIAWLAVSFGVAVATILIARHWARPRPVEAEQLF